MHVEVAESDSGMKRFVDKVWWYDGGGDDREDDVGLQTHRI